MVRILKVNGLEERKRLLLMRSEMHRQTLKLEAANIKYSAALFRRKFKLVRAFSRLLGVGVPLAGLFFFRRRPKPVKTGNGIVSKLFSGIKFLGQLRPLLQGIRGGAEHRETRRKNITRFP